MRRVFNIQVLGAVFLFLAAFAASLHFSQNPFDAYWGRTDASVYQYIATRMFDGDMPYRDIFDHKGPVIYFWHMMGVFIHPMFGQWVIELLALWFSGMMAFGVARRFCLPFLSLFITAAFLMYLPGEDILGNTESFFSLCLYYLIFIWVKDYEKGVFSLRSGLIFGIIGAMLFMLKPNYVVSVAWLWGFAIIKMFYLKKNHDAFQFIGGTFFSGCLVVLSILVWLYYNEALADFWEDFILYNAAYVQEHNHHSFMVILKYFMCQPMVKFFGVCLGVCVLFYKKLTIVERKMCAIFAGAWGINFLFAVCPRDFLNHYLYTLMPFSFMVCVFMLKALYESRCKSVAYLLVIALLGLNGYRTYMTAFDTKDDSGKAYFNEVKDMGQVIERLVPEDEKFFVIGWNMNTLYLVTGRGSVSKYPLSASINRIYPEKLYDDVKKENPKFVVVQKGDFYEYEDKLHAYWPEFFEYELVYENKAFRLLKMK